MNVQGMTHDHVARVHIVWLKGVHSNVMMPIIINRAAAKSIYANLTNARNAHATPYELVYKILGHLDCRVQEVRILALKDGEYQTVLILDSDEQQVLMNIRTSDAIVLALKFRAPIYVTEDVQARVEHAFYDSVLQRSPSAEPVEKVQPSPMFEDTLQAAINELLEQTKAETQEKRAHTPLEKLEQRLQRAVAFEDYESACEIQKQIEKLKREMAN